jgi:hypothetical protein
VKRQNCTLRKKWSGFALPCLLPDSRNAGFAIPQGFPHIPQKNFAGWKTLRDGRERKIAGKKTKKGGKMWRFANQNRRRDVWQRITYRRNSPISGFFQTILPRWSPKRPRHGAFLTPQRPN